MTKDATKKCTKKLDWPRIPILMPRNAQLNLSFQGREALFELFDSMSKPRQAIAAPFNLT